jgi:hypothetical protein
MDTGSPKLFVDAVISLSTREVNFRPLPRKKMSRNQNISNTRLSANIIVTDVKQCGANQDELAGSKWEKEQGKTDSCDCVLDVEIYFSFSHLTVNNHVSFRHQTLGTQ